MTTATDQKQGKLAKKGMALIILGLIMFPALILLPFLMHSSQKHLVALTTQSNLTLHCNTTIGNGPSVLSKVNQCAGWQSPTSIHVVVLFGTLLLLILGTLTLLYSRLENHRAFKRFAAVSSLTALVVATASIIAYSVLHGYSQQAQGGYFSANQLSNGNYVVNRPPALGYGLNPYYVVLFSALYLLVPLANLINYYRPLIDPRYVGGVKKERLFQ